MSLETPEKIRSLQRKLILATRYRTALLERMSKRRRSRSSASTFCTTRSTAKTFSNTLTNSPRGTAARRAWTGSHSHKSIAIRISDRHILRLIKMWLKAPVEERDENGGKRMTGGKTAKKGTPQGGVISPLLANRYMNRFLKYWTKTEQPRRLRAQIVSYADDFVILSRGRAAEAPDWTRNAITRLGLTLNEAKTRLKDARRERFEFPGYSFGLHWHQRDGKPYLGASPSPKSVARLKQNGRDQNGRDHLKASHGRPWPDIRDGLNAILRGWDGYFCYGTRWRAHRAINANVVQSVRGFLVRRHKVQSRGTVRFSGEAIFGELGVLSLSPKL